ncbi:MAG: Rieske 2Fe-2S domain-containing protein, partial [Acidimicrobiales bacterium]|nr:Rieske 2Fe-2S domain-containing protein [Acidimicrobiales bacterium]
MTKPDLMSSTALRAHWHVVAGSVDVSPGPHGVTLLGDDYVLWRDPEGRIVAGPDTCPHREAPLSSGTVADGCLSCPYHGWA